MLKRGCLSVIINIGSVEESVWGTAAERWRYPILHIQERKRDGRMIRLVASDIDGTLLKNGARTLPEEVFSAIRSLKERGILFCAASGRQYSSLRRLFAPVADDIYYICENGAAVYGSGKDALLLGKTVMERRFAEQLSEEILARPDSEVLISGANTSYLIPKEQEIVVQIRDFTGNNICLLSSVKKVPEDIIKVSAFCSPDTKTVERELSPRWEGRFHGAVAGARWLDFTLSDKGTGIRTICNALKIALEDVMAFGDNFNDIPMLEAVGNPVLMSQADDRLRRRFLVQCEDVPKYLYENVLQ